ncbi:hypothetical protein F2P56_031472 [Juglans regia]|uniref:beta-carotene 3-hydroxylase n=1 Tax=Juglans regia TaxID=51240 RepID=A0A833U5V9_JUGRE|nr:hypothetical protein F2P56_031472 [Juglans regia]
MAARLLASSSTPKPAFRIYQYSQLLHKPTTALAPSLLHRSTIIKTSRKTCFTLCVIMDDQKQSSQLGNLVDEGPEGMNYQIPSERAAERLARKRSERFTYLVAAVMSSFGITSMAVMAVYYRFSWQMEVLPSASVYLSVFLSLLKDSLCIFMACRVDFVLV